MRQGCWSCHGGTKGRAFTAVEVVAVVFIIVVLSILLAYLLRQRARYANRTRCAANLKSIGNAFATYSTGGADDWPMPHHLPPGEDGQGKVRYAPGRIGMYRERQSTGQDVDVSTTRSSYLMIVSGARVPEDFVCPGSADWANNQINPRIFWDFRNYNEISYGVLVPFGRMAKLNPNVEQEMGLVADKGPYSAALEAGRPHPGTPNADAASGNRNLREYAPAKWKPWNSPNHGGEGQNVMYNDAHVEFWETPLAGVHMDNIYTQWGSPQGSVKDRAHGKPPTGIETPLGRTDSLIYP